MTTRADATQRTPIDVDGERYVDLQSMLQCRFDNPNRRRQVRREVVPAPVNRWLSFGLVADPTAPGWLRDTEQQGSWAAALSTPCRTSGDGGCNASSSAAAAVDGEGTDHPLPDLRGVQPQVLH